MSPNNSERRRYRSGASILAALLALAGLDACASGGPVRLDVIRPLGTELVWPSPPDSAKVRFVRSFGSADELGFRRSIFGRLLDLVRGRDEGARLRHPYGVAVTLDDRIYVVDSSAGSVHEFDLARGRHRVLRNASFEHPIGVAVDRDGRVFVTDSELGAVIILDGGEEVARLAAGLIRPTGIAIDPATQRVYVVDTGAHEVVIFDSDGVRRGEFGERGTAPGELNYPTLVAVGPSGNVYVSDTLNFRVQVFTPTGEPIRSLGRLGDAIGEFARPKGLGVDAQGRVFVVEGLYDVVNIFDAEGRLLLTFGGAGQAEGAFWLATGLAVDRHGRIFVSDSYNGRVQVFELTDAAQ